MIFELEQKDYHKIRKLIKGEEDYVKINAVVAGTNRGRIYADNVDCPGTALVWAMGSMFFLVGDPDNEDFVNSLDSHIFEKISPQCIESYGNTYLSLMNLSGRKWDTRIKSIFKHRFPRVAYREELMLNIIKYRELKDWRTSIPDGCYIKNVDVELAGIINKLSNNEILETWASFDEFVKKGIGFCLMKGDRVISSCISNYIGRDEAGVSLFTYSFEDRNKGYGTIAARAFIDECLLRNLAPSWGTWENNYGAVAIAEKLGFDRINRYPVYIMLFNEYYNLVSAGYDFLRNPWSIPTAMEILEKAVDKGWRDIEHLKYYMELKGLLKSEDCQKLIERLEKKIQQA